MRFLIFIGGTIGSYAGWALSDYLGGGFFVSFIVSSIAAGVGIYIAWKIALDLE
jgi:hypothetical protein